MKLSCEIVQDLLPLYEEDLCSKASKEAIEEHLKECPDCRKQEQHLQNFSEPEFLVQSNIEKRAVTKSFRTIRRRWAVSLIAMLLVVPLIFLTSNQVRGTGVCYTNIDEIFTARKFIQALEEEDFQESIGMMNFKDGYQQIQSVLEKEKEDYMPNYISVIIGQDEWMAQESVYQNYLKTTEIDQEFWEDIIFDYTNFMIPIDIWNEIVSETPNLFNEGEGEFWVNDEFNVPYVLLETKWGTYMVRQGSSLQYSMTAAEFCLISGLVPVEIYQEAVPELEKMIAEDYQNTREYYAEVIDMSSNEFEEIMQERHYQELEKAGFKFENTGYIKSIYNKEQECWNITYGVEVNYQGEDYPVSIQLGIVDEEIIDIEISWSQEFSEGDILHKALSMYYIQ